MIEEYLKKFYNTGDHRERYGKQRPSAWHFCDNREDADALAALVLAGIKRGTASLASSYAVEDEKIPEPGDLSVLLNWAGEPQCVIETLRVWSWPFSEVPSWFAKIEGEGDGSLEYWRRAHRAAFGREATELGIPFDDGSPVICEEFRVIYP